MREMRLRYGIRRICRLTGVSPSGYYKWLKRKPSKRALEEGRLEAEIQAAHKRTRETCGPERLQRDLAHHGVRVGIWRIGRIRKKLGIRCKQARRFKATTHSRHTLPVAENLLNQQFSAMAPNEVISCETDASRKQSASQVASYCSGTWHYGSDEAHVGPLLLRAGRAQPRIF